MLYTPPNGKERYKWIKANVIKYVGKQELIRTAYGSMNSAANPQSICQDLDTQLYLPSFDPAPGDIHTTSFIYGGTHL